MTKENNKEKSAKYNRDTFCSKFPNSLIATNLNILL